MRAWIATTVLLASCGGEEVKIECGNGFVEEGEQCDGDDLNTVTCEGRGFFAGDLGCNADCTFDTTGCTNCGNGVLDTGEACDDTELGDATCADSGLVDGTLACDATCALDTTGCEPPPSCGNGALDVGEQCEGSDLDGESCAGLGYLSGDLACTGQCRYDLDTCSGCTDDGFEENDVLGSAAALSEGSHAATLCNLDGSEIDWYAVALLTGETLAVLVHPGDSMFGFSSGISDDTGADIGAQVAGGAWLFTASADITVHPWVAPHLQQRGVGGYGIDVIIDPGCIEHLDCSGGELCEDFACVASNCADDDECPGDFSCHNTACVECVDGADCGSADWFSCNAGRCSFDCAADGYEPNQTHDAPAAVAVGLDASGLTLCGGEDWYEVTLVEGQRYRVDATFLHAGGDIDLELYAASDATVLLAGASSYSDDESMVFAPETGLGGAHLVRVRLAGDAVAQSYDLAITDLGVADCFDDDTCTGADEVCLDYSCVVPVCLADDDCTGTERCAANDCVARPTGDVCSDAIVVASLPHSASADMAAFRGDVDAGSCTEDGTEGHDVIYRVTLAAGDTLVAELASDFDAALWVASECAAGATCLAGVDEIGTGERLEVTVASAGDVYVVVDSFAPGFPEDGGFTLELSLQP